MEPARPRALAIQKLGAAAAGEISPGEIADWTPWMREVVQGAVRWRGRIDWLLGRYSQKKKPTGWLRRALEIGIYQLLAQPDTPVALVINETVEEIKRKDGAAPAGFANALLRKVAADRERWGQGAYPPEDITSEQLSAWYSVPAWMWRKWEAYYGADWAARYARGSLTRPSVWLHCRTAELASRLAADGLGEVGPVPGSFRWEGASPFTERPEFRAGEFFVQDLSSQRVLFEAGGIVKSRGGADAEVLDLCAAPGGKTMGLAWQGYRVTASDVDPGRITRLRENLARVGATSVKVSSPEGLGETRYDWVWVDAPCTSTGLLRRHPEVRWTKQEAGLKSLLAIQSQLLDEGAVRVRPQGYLLYSVCSVLPEEGPQCVEAWLAARASADNWRSLAEWRLSPADPGEPDGFFATLLFRGD